MKARIKTTVAGGLAILLLAATGAGAAPRDTVTVRDGDVVRTRASSETFTLDRRFPVGGSAAIDGFVNQDGLTQTTRINGGVLNVQQLGEDTLDLSNVDADISTRRDDRFTLVDAFSGNAGELVINRNAEGDAIVAGDVDGDAVADITITLVSRDARLSGTFDNNLIL